MIDGQPVMEVLLYKHRKTGITTLPGNFVDADEQLPHGLTQELTEAIVAYAVGGRLMICNESRMFMYTS